MSLLRAPSLHDPVDGASTSVALPPELPAWLAEALQSALEETEVVRQNGAHEAATARDRMLQQIIAAAEAWLSGEISTDEAAALIERDPETVRRAVRSGAIRDARSRKKGRISIRRRDALRLVGGRQNGYDPVADAQDIAQLRSRT